MFRELEENFISYRSQLQSSMNRMLTSLGIQDGANNNLSFQQRILRYFRHIFGDKLKYILFVFMILLFCVYAIAIQGIEKQSWTFPDNSSDTPAANSNSTVLLVNTTTISVNGTGNSTIHDTHQRNESTISIWFSVIISLISWIAVIQILRYIRNAQTSNPNHQRQREQLRFLTQLSRSNIPGLSTRLRLALLNRDFTGDDYEMLQQLDEVRFDGGPVVSQGASEASIQRLPLHTLSAADFQIRTDDSFIGNCNICLAPYEIGDEVRTVLCLHKFHKQCIDPWLRTKNICPICKYPATEESS